MIILAIRLKFLDHLLMSKILFFIHGTGVRRGGFDASYRLIQQKLVEHQCEVRLEACYWGDEFGAQLPSNSKSVPDYSNTRNVDDWEEDQEIAIWRLLTEDPTFELSLLSSSAGEAEDYPINRPHPGQQLENRFNGLATNADLAGAIRELGMEDTSSEIIQCISQSPAFESANKSAASGTAQHRSALARAVVAELLSQAIDAGAPIYDREARDELIDKLERALGHDARGIVSAPANWYFRSRRGKLTDKHYEKFGDILRYQARGDELRSFLRDKIAGFANDQVTILAHSLGGIAAFETLIQYELRNVAHLVTFGSQAPFLYEIDALARLRRGTSLPDNFPAWTNFYDLADPLSYKAEGIFDERVVDHEVKSGQMLLAAHSAYLHNKPFWHYLSSRIKLV